MHTVPVESNKTIFFDWRADAASSNYNLNEWMHVCFLLEFQVNRTDKIEKFFELFGTSCVLIFVRLHVMWCFFFLKLYRPFTQLPLINSFFILDVVLRYADAYYVSSYYV